MAAGSTPTRRATPASMPSSRSVRSRSTSTGVPNVGASSWMPAAVGQHQAGAGEVADERRRSRTARAARRCRSPRGRPAPGPPRWGWGAPGRRTAPPGSRRASSAIAPRMPSSGDPKLSRRCTVTSTSSPASWPPVAHRRAAAIDRSASTAVLPVRWTRSAGAPSASSASRRPAGRREVGGGEHVDDPTVRLLGERVGQVAGAQPGLDVADPRPRGGTRPAPVAAGRRGVALHQQPVRLHLGEHRVDRQRAPGRPGR